MLNACLSLKRRGIRPTLPRLAVAKAALSNFTHPSADGIWALVRKKYPAVSRATVYNTLELFVRKGLIQRKALKGGSAAYDPVLERHHHLVDERTGRIYDIPWAAVRLPARLRLPGFEVEDFHLVIKGKKRK
ncbi:MAG: Fur family transcriptional regulator peroxide stress response regulator [Elusimicrobia bacterium]|nr:MAG: Fur family transcriptional regulator peroxide stress response regulator [Elusimicrobiota bacterium]KAF0153790.1 MAG: Fur family transcriptional regulator peroxide stress response regulator [Elusimicrobiota bacterium]